MKAGEIVLAQVPQADAAAKIRPALLLCQFPPYGDWLACGISSQIRQLQPSFDELLESSAPDFSESGLRASSVIRLGFLTTLPARQIGGALGNIRPARLQRLRRICPNTSRACRLPDFSWTSSPPSPRWKPLAVTTSNRSWTSGVTASPTPKRRKPEELNPLSKRMSAIRYPSIFAKVTGNDPYDYQRFDLQARWASKGVGCGADFLLQRSRATARIILQQGHSPQPVTTQCYRVNTVNTDYRPYYELFSLHHLSFATMRGGCAIQQRGLRLRRRRTYGGFRTHTPH